MAKLKMSKGDHSAPKDGVVVSPPAETREAKLANAFEDFESRIGDLENMVEVVASTIEGVINDTRVTGEPGLHHIPKQKAEAALFVVYHLQEIMEAVSEQYYNVMEEASFADGSRHSMTPCN